MYESNAICSKHHQVEEGFFSNTLIHFDLSRLDLVSKQTSEAETRKLGNHWHVQAEDPDFILVEAAKKGERRAFDLLVVKYQTRIASLVSNYFKDFESVNDVVQEVFIRVYRNIDKFRGDSRFYTWLYRIAKNTALCELKRAYRHRELSGLEIDQNDIAFAGESLDSAYANNRMAKIIDNALVSLPTKLRIAIVLREKKGLGYDEIAEVLGCETGTVKSRIFRAREILARKLEKYL